MLTGSCLCGGVAYEVDTRAGMPEFPEGLGSKWRIGCARGRLTWPKAAY